MCPIIKAESVNTDRMIQAIAQIEGGEWGEPGGICCISYDAWSDRSSFAYQLSVNKDYAMRVYSEHIAWICANLERRKIKVTPATIYLAWRRGFEGARKILRTGPMPDAAIRCQNIYESLSHENR